MAQNISLMGASYPNVPSVKLPKTGGGQASFVDVTGATLSSSDGGKILTGETAYGRDGNKITGTMLDYRDFDLYGIKVKVDRVAPGADSDTLTIPACDLSGRPVQFILAFAAGPTVLNNMSTTSSSGSNTIVTVMYDRKQNITNSSGVAQPFYTASCRPRYYQSKAWMSWSIAQGSSTVTLENESGLAAGTAYLHSTGPYFKGGMYYLLMVGG